MSRGPDVMALAQAERTDLLELLTSLDPSEWDAPTLCVGWTVRDVVAHVLSYDERSVASLAGTFARGRLSFARTNDVAMRDYADHGPDELLALLERSLRPRGLTAGFGGGIALTDGLIHHQDIRRPLGRPRTVPTERLAAALSIAISAPTLPSRRHMKGLQLVATDLEWRHGRGPEIVEGPGESLLMLVAGRGVALVDASGPGTPVLADRLGERRVA